MRTAHFTLFIRNYSLCAALFLLGCDGQSTTPSPDVTDVAMRPDTLDATVACNGPMTEDLAALSPVTGGAIDYATSNSLTADGPENALQPGPSCGFLAVHERLFRYTTRSMAALQVSTDNPGTDTAFDSVLFVTRTPCALPPSVLGCNDDDPYGPRNPHVTSSYVLTPVLPAGTTVIIAVAGFYPTDTSMQPPAPEAAVGTFELTVHELLPLAAGAMCSPTDGNNPCTTGTTCIADDLGATHYSCRADGATAGSQCTSAGTCTAPLVCDATINRCYQTGVDGAPCDRFDVMPRRCATGFTCISSVRGLPVGVCRANGSVALSNCATGNMCAQGLVCSSAQGRNPTCLRQIPADGACWTLDTQCSDGQGCVLNGGGASVGRCSANGTALGSACRTTVPECDGDLACITGGLDRTCRSVGRMIGDACGAMGVCSFDYQCIPTDSTEPYQGICTALGTQGAACRATGSACDAGLTCTNPTTRNQGRCVHAGAIGDACDFAHVAVRCATGSSCVPGPTTTGTCQADGSAPGTACRATSTRCNTGLTCSATSGAGVCQTDPTASACDPRFATIHCPTGQVCDATSLAAGTCAPPISETEPNEIVPAPNTALPARVAIAGSLTRFDLDCFPLDVVANGTVFSSVVGSNGLCAETFSLDLYDPNGEWLGSDTNSGPFGCPRIEGADPNSFAWARDLSAGRYSLCIREATDRHAVPNYVLSVAVGSM